MTKELNTSLLQNNYNVVRRLDCSTWRNTKLGIIYVSALHFLGTLRLVFHFLGTLKSYITDYCKPVFFNFLVHFSISSYFSFHLQHFLPKVPFLHFLLYLLLIHHAFLLHFIFAFSPSLKLLSKVFLIICYVI